VLGLLKEKKAVAEMNLKDTFSMNERNKFDIHVLEKKEMEYYGDGEDPGVQLQRRKELAENLKRDLEHLQDEVRALAGLIIRFQDLLDGKKRGRPKLLSEMARDFLSSELGPKKEGVLAVNLVPTAILVGSGSEQNDHANRMSRTGLEPNSSQTVDSSGQGE
jgi:hypothetical protein